MNIKDTTTRDISLDMREYTVMVYDLDINRSSTMPMVCNWLQDTGITHALMIAKEGRVPIGDIVFVLTRLRVQMERYPYWQEKVTVESWLSPITDRYVKRNFILHGADGKIIGRGINSAVPFNLRVRAGETLPPDLDYVPVIERESALPHDFIKIPQTGSPEYERSVTVRYFDCDLNRHINNVRYIQWCLETIPDEYISSHRPCDIDINFRAEGNLGDTLSVTTQRGAVNDTFIHTISGSQGGKDLVRMTSAWTQ